MSAADPPQRLSRQQRRQAERDARKAQQRGGPGSRHGAAQGAEARFLDALRAHAEGRPDVAERGYREVLAGTPDHAGALRFLGLLIDHRTQLVDAINGLPAGFATQARRGDADHQAAVALAALGRRADAEQALRRALDADPQHGPALALLSELRRGAGGLDEAAALARRAVGASDSSSAHKQLGLALAEQERVVEAVTSLRRAAEMVPNDGQTWLSLGNVQLAMGSYGDALVSFERARDLEPDAAATYNNIAVTLLGLGRFREAAQASARAVELDPGNAQYRYNRAFGLLGHGDLAEGWEPFEEGFAAGGRQPAREFPVPRWDGTPSPGAALLIWREQGVGDELRLASCYEEAAERVGRVIVETDPRLVTLLSRSFPWATVRPQTTGPPQPDFDVQIPAASLPRHLRPSLDAFPQHDGYLVADPPQRARFRERLDSLGDGLKVGISWRSMNLGVGRLGHYTVLDEWDPVLALPGVHFVNLQYGVPEQVVSELDVLRDRTGAEIVRWDDVDYTRDFEAMAGLVAELDVVVGVGTTPVLLAGALGRPAYVLTLPDPLSFQQPRYPWLPSVVRCEKQWDEPWSGPIGMIADALRELAG